MTEPEPADRVRRRLLQVAGAALLFPDRAKSETPAADTDLLELGAQAAVKHIRNGDMKAETYAAGLLKQYRAQKSLNAVLFIDEERVLEQAHTVDLARTRGDKLSRAAGLPFAVKDQIAVAGYPATGGSAALRGYIPKESATVVDAIVKAGGIVFAKTNLPDMVGATGTLANAAATANPYFGATHNPYDLSHIPGGSSGGNASAVAARIVPAAIGEDTGGSIRFPASFCGICGLRPSTYTIKQALKEGVRKRYSDAGIVIPPAGPRDTFGPMARTVADLAFLDAIITGEPTPTINLRDVRIAIPRADYWDQDYVDHGITIVMQSAFAKLRDAGAQLLEVDFEAVRSIGGEQLDPALGIAGRRSPDENIAKWLRENLPMVTVEEVTKGQTSGVGHPPSLEAGDRTRRLKAAAQEYTNLFRLNGITAVAFPTMTIPAPPINPKGETMEQTVMVNGKTLEQIPILGRNIRWGPRLGAPGLTIPAGLARGLPVGLELEGLPGTDTELLALGIAAQDALGKIPAPLLQY